MMLDDLQWAGADAIRFFNDVLADGGLNGLLLVGTYRESEVDAAHPLSAVLPRWQWAGASLMLLRLENLLPIDLADLLAEMLTMTSEQAASLAEAVGLHTGGNPCDTVELINAFWRDGVLYRTQQIDHIPGTDVAADRRRVPIPTAVGPMSWKNCWRRRSRTACW